MAGHKPDDVAIVTEVTGQCNACKHHTSARLVGYYSGEILIRCNHCKVANKFVPDDKGYTDPKKFLPFLNDEDTEK